MIIDRPNCNKWRQDPTTNPVSRRSIQPNKYTYNLFKRYCDLTDNDCNKWRENPRKNPLTNRKIKLITTRESGIYNQIQGICNSTNPVSPKSPINLFKSDSSTIADMIEKQLEPAINKKEIMLARIIRMRTIKKYLVNIKPCLQKHDSSLSLLNKKDEVRVILMDSMKQGISYPSIGTKNIEHVAFTTKILKNTREADEEIAIAKRLSELVETHKNPHFLFIYKDIACEERCDFEPCPPNTKSANGYRLLMSETANMDLLKFLETKRSPKIYANIISQMMIAIYSLHKAGYIHHDTHLKNFLIVKVKDGGHWHYNIDGRDYYLENTGFIVVLWDFGEAESSSGNNYKIVYKDYVNPLRILSNLKKHHPNVNPLPPEMQEKLKFTLKHIKKNLAKFPDNVFIQQIIDFSNNFLGVPDVLKKNRKGIEGSIINPVKCFQI